MLLRRNEASYEALSRELKAGRVVVMACDTIYGLVGKAPDTNDAIRDIKGRGESKPFLMLLSDAAELESLGVEDAEDPILSLWPGPFTFIFPTKTGETIACRVPEDSRLRALISSVGAPLYSTSVNRAGQPLMEDPAAIDEEFGDEVALIEDSGLYSGKLPSTLVDLSVSPRKILRQGAGEVPEEFL